MRDPRNRITETALNVSPDLVDQPLASRHLRLLAMLIYLCVIGLLAVTGTYLFAFAAGVLALIILKPRKERSMGVKAVGWFGAGLTALLVTILTGYGFSDKEAINSLIQIEAIPAEDGGSVLTGLGAAKLALLATRISTTKDALQAEKMTREAVEFLENSEAVDMVSSNEFLTDLAQSSNDVAVRDVILKIKAELEQGSGEKKQPDVEKPLPPEELLIMFAQQYDQASEQTRIRHTLDQLEQVYTGQSKQKIEQLNKKIASKEQRIAKMTAQLNMLRDPSPLTMAKNFIEKDLGLATGWSVIYFTLLLTLWGGRTVGKWICRIRVIRLDGKPVTLWMAFERFGGYAAGFATSLLGFIQIYWDANRQCIHDKVANTVVVPSRLIKN